MKNLYSEEGVTFSSVQMQFMSVNNCLACSPAVASLLLLLAWLCALLVGGAAMGFLELDLITCVTGWGVWFEEPAWLVPLVLIVSVLIPSGTLYGNGWGLFYKEFVVNV